MAMRSSISIQATAASFLMFSFLLLAAEQVRSSTPPSPIGTVKEIRRGTLERQERDRWTPLTAGMAISANDRVRTSADGTAVLSLREIGAILIGPGTEYYLGHSTGDFKTLLKHGYLWISAKLAPGSTMSVATESAVAGVRGTKFSVIQDTKGMAVCTCKGAVEVSLRDGKSMNVASGMYGEINASGTMGTPERGKPHLEELWKKKTARYAPCLNCHKRGEKIRDLN